MAAGRQSTARSQVVQIVDAIRDGVQTGHYAPGHRLIESDLTREFGVSRGPVREALGRLQVEGLVEITPHRGASVRQMSPQDVKDLVVVRQMLQGGAARLAALNVDRADYRERLQRALAETRRWTKTRDIVGYIEANDALHDLILEMAENELLSNMVSQLRVRAFRLLFAGILSVQHVRESAVRHVAIATAVLEGRPDDAETAMRRQLQQTAEQALALIEQRATRRLVAVDGNVPQPATATSP